MIIAGIVDEDFTHYKQSAMLVLFPTCSMKCERLGAVCNHKYLYDVDAQAVQCFEIVNRYLENKNTSTIVFGGLEPFDSYSDLLQLICEFRKVTEDLIIIYTGYDENEISDELNYLSNLHNIIVKFGRQCNMESHKDEILGVDVKSSNQYAKIIAKPIDIKSESAPLVLNHQLYGGFWKIKFADDVHD